MPPAVRPSMTIVELVALAVWLGAAILFAGVVAPALFATMPSRSLAGDVVGRVLPVLLYSGLALAVLVLAGETRMGTRAGVLAGVIIGGASVYALLVGQRIDRLRTSLAMPVDSLPPDDPRRLDFGRLHGVSVALLGLAMLAALALGVALVRRLASRADGFVPQPVTEELYHV